MTAASLPDQVSQAGKLDPEALIGYVEEVGATSGLGSRVNYNLACWYAGRAQHAGRPGKDQPTRSALEKVALGQLELAVAGGAYVRKVARTDPSLKWLRRTRNKQTVTAFWKLVGKDGEATGELADLAVVGVAWSRLLATVDVKTLADLRKRLVTAEERADLAARLDAPIATMTEWKEAMQLADLVGSVPAANLVSQAGIATVKQLASANAAVLARRLSRINESPKVLLQDPEEPDVTAWIAGAKRVKP